MQCVERDKQIVPRDRDHISLLIQEVITYWSHSLTANLWKFKESPTVNFKTEKTLITQRYLVREKSKSESSQNPSASYPFHIPSVLRPALTQPLLPPPFPLPWPPPYTSPPPSQQTLQSELPPTPQTRLPGRLPP